jgi:hypothetical protein
MNHVERTTLSNSSASNQIIDVKVSAQHVQQWEDLRVGYVSNNINISAGPVFAMKRAR